MDSAFAAYSAPVAVCSIALAGGGGACICEGDFCRAFVGDVTYHGAAAIFSDGTWDSRTFATHLVFYNIFCRAFNYKEGRQTVSDCKSVFKCRLHLLGGFLSACVRLFHQLLSLPGCSLPGAYGRTSNKGRTL